MYTYKLFQNIIKQFYTSHCIYMHPEHTLCAKLSTWQYQQEKFILVHVYQNNFNVRYKGNRCIEIMHIRIQSPLISTTCPESSPSPHMTCSVTSPECQFLCSHLYTCDKKCYNFDNEHICKHIHKVHSLVGRGTQSLSQPHPWHKNQKLSWYGG